FYFFYDRVVRLLYSMGHDVRIVCRPGFESDGNKSGRTLLKLLADVPQAKLEDARFREKRASWAITIRELANYANFLRPGHPMPPTLPWENIYMRGRIHPKLYWAVKTRIGSAVFSTGFVRWLLRKVESFFKPEPRIVEWLEEYKPDVLVASPYNMTADLEIEYVKAAQQLGIQTISSVLSWDNLVSKGTYLVKPEWLFVWNNNLTEEAIKLHEFERENVFITGAPVYDPWFDLALSVNREKFCRQCGVDPKNPYVLFLGSSKTITNLDVEFIMALIAHFEQVDVKSRPSIIIRPHPYAPFDMTTFENDWVKAFPKKGGRPDIDETRQTYFDTLYHSAVVVGINTTGFLDAAIVDKPCVTLMDDQMRDGQGAHFNYLINADFIEVAKERSETFKIIDRIISGMDAKMENRRKFVHQFMRPQGMDIPASVVMTKAILAVGRGAKPEDWNV
ncbi:MAG: hypothetical protein Q7J80_07010, partial [Anaerolineales bacterium]|nr:hypothetical protein [Anaerolineales bacterium]